MRKPAFRRTGIGAKPKTPPPPAARRYDFETILCSAINGLQQVELKYDDDLDTRLFEPYAVYPSSTGKILVSGTQIRDNNDRRDEFEPHEFEVGKLRFLRITETVFRPDPRFNPSLPKYRKGFICRIR